MPTLAPAPKQSTGSFTITLGLLPIPVRLLSPVQDTRLVERKMFTKDGHAVKMPYTDEETGERVEFSEIVKMVQVDDDKFVELSDDEIAAVTAGQAVDKGTVKVETFVPVDAIGTRYKVKSEYQLRPQKREVNRRQVDDPNANKLFTLLIETLKAENVAALVRVGLRTEARYGAVTPDGRFCFLHFDAEVREQYPLPDVTLSDGDIEAARGLVKAVGVDTPDLINEAKVAVNEYLERKIAGNAEDLTIEAAPEAPAEMDLAAMLAASIASISA